MATQLQKMMLVTYADMRKQNQQSFYSALIVAVIGAISFIVATSLRMDKPGLSITLYITGGLFEVISGKSLFLYSKTAKQVYLLHACLERTNRYLLANTFCDNISCPVKKDEAIIELINIISNAPLVNMELGDSKTKYYNPIKLMKVSEEESKLNGTKNVA